MASLTQWTWVWVDSGSCWWTGRPGVLWFMGLQRARRDWATKPNWTVRWTNFNFFIQLLRFISQNLENIVKWKEKMLKLPRILASRRTTWIFCTFLIIFFWKICQVSYFLEERVFDLGKFSKDKTSQGWKECPWDS